MNWGEKARAQAKETKRLVISAEDELPARYCDDLNEIYRGAELLEQLAKVWDEEHPICTSCVSRHCDCKKPSRKVEE